MQSRARFRSQSQYAPRAAEAAQCNYDAMALTVCAATFPCPCPPPTPSTKLVLHYCSFTALTDGTTLHCVLLSLQCFRHFEKVKDAFTYFPARFRDSTVAEQNFVSLAYPAAHFSLPNPSASSLPQDFISLAYPAAQFSLPNPSASPLPQDFVSLSRLPCRPLQAPKPQRFLTSLTLRLSLAYPAAHFSLPNPSASPLPQDFISLAYPAAHFSLPNPSASPLPQDCVSLSLTLPPTSASQTPELPHFLNTSSVSQPPKPQRLLTSSRLRLSLAYPAAHFSLPNPSASPLPEDFISLAYPDAHFSLPYPSASSLPQDFVCTLPPTSGSQTPALPHFLKTSSLSLALRPTSGSQTPALPHFLKTSSLSCLPCRPLQPPKPQHSPHFLQNPLQFARHTWSQQLRGGVPGHRQSPFILASSRRHAQSVDG
jgi:hypothetical protein